VTGCGGTPKTCTPLWTAVPKQGEPAGPKSPVVADGIVYVGFVDTLYAFDAAGVTGCSGTPKTCTPLWTGNTHCFNIFVSMSPAAVARGVIHVACDAHDEMFGSGRLFAFDAAGTTGCSGTPKTCEPLWSAFSGAVDSSPAVADGLVYVNDFTAHGDIEPATGTLRAFDAAGVSGCSGVPKTCMPLWTAEIGPSRSSPAVAKGVVYVVVDTTLSAFDAAGTTGCSGTPKVCSPLWTASPGGSTSSSVAVANGVVYVHFNTFGPSSSIHGFDAGGTTGCSGAPKVCSPIWTANTENFGASSPAVANGVVYASTEDKLFAFNLPRAPQSASDCKNGGWRNFVDDAGRPFANQGQCVSSVVSRRT
jgi:hypothetical protein